MSVTAASDCLTCKVEQASAFVRRLSGALGLLIDGCWSDASLRLSRWCSGLLDVAENLIDEMRFSDICDYPQRTAAQCANGHIELERAAEPLSPAQALWMR